MDTSSSGTKSPTFTPYIPASQSLPEITLKAVILGFILSAVLAGANAYLGLKVGLTVSASIPAAVISMAILRFFRTSNILENNIVQTAASAGESIAAGVIFTLPALLMLQYWQGFDFLATMSIALTGGVLGVLFTIPLRRALIIETQLHFPEGVATGEVLKAGSEGGEGARYIALAGAAGAALKLCQTGFRLVADSAAGAVQAGRAVFGYGTELGVALLGVGYIVGLNIAILVFAGGLISWLFGIPIYTAVASPEELAAITEGATGYEAALAVWSERIRYLGVGAMAIGGVWALLSLVKPIKDGILSSLDAVRQARSGERSEVLRTDRDTPINIVLWGTLAMSVPIFLSFLLIVDQEALGITAGLYWGTLALGLVFALLAGFLFASVAGYMAGLVGSSNNPISGVTIATILSTSLLLLWVLGSQINFAVDAMQATTAAATAILVGAVVCCAAAIAGDNMQDLKAGYLVGRHPVQAANHAGRGRRGRRPGAGAYSGPAVPGIRPRRCIPERRYGPVAGASGSASHAHEFGRGRRIPTGPAVEHDHSGRAHCRRHHCHGQVPGASRRRIPHAGAGRRRRHLFAAGVDRPHLHRRTGGLFRQPFVASAQGSDRWRGCV